MKNSNFKKGLSLFLAIIMLFTMVPATVFAAEESLPTIKSYSGISASNLPDHMAYRDSIVTATFLDNVDTTGAVMVWDVSEKGDGSVKAWIKNSAEGAGMYDLYIGGTGGIQANVNSSNFFYNFTKLKEVNGIENFKTGNVESFESFFHLCESLQSLDLSSFDTSSAKTFAYFFSDCLAIEGISLTGWNTENVTDMKYMFHMCKNLPVLDLSSFNTRNVKNMSRMFYHNDVNTTIYIGDDWVVDQVTSSSAMFNCCYVLKGPVTWSQYYTDKYYAHKDGYLTYRSAAKEYTVSYEFIGDVPENAVVPETFTYNRGSVVDVAEVSKIEGYVFEGWETDDAVVEDGKVTVNNDIHFVGKWSKLYTVTYKFDDGYKLPDESLTPPETATYKKGDIVTVEGYETFGEYTFDGWNSEDVVFTSGTFEMPGKDVVLSGHYKKDITDIIIKDIVDGGFEFVVGDDAKIDVKIEPEDATNKVLHFESSDENIVTVDQDGNVKAKNEGTAIITIKTTDGTEIKKEIHVTVNKVTYTVAYRYEGEVIPENAPTYEVKTYEEGATVTVEDAPEVDGYEFSGWSTEDADITNGEFEIYNDVIIVGSWNKTHKVKYQYIGEVPEGAPAYEEKTYVEGTTVTVEDTPYVEGYEFIGWVSTDADITNKEFEIYNDVVIIGRWCKLYNVEYKYTGDIPENAPQYDKKIYKEGEIVAVEETPEVKGYTFGGWTSEDVDITSGEFEINKDVVIVGNWTKINYYDVTYKFEGDVPAGITAPNTATYEEGKNVVVADTPYADGYVFSGWSTEDADITNGNFDIYNDVEIVGKWTKINYYDVTYKYIGEVPPMAPEYEVETYKEGSTVTVKGDAQAEGYIFSGWSSVDADITKGSFTINKDVVIIGSWTRIPYYSVDYKYEGDVPKNAPKYERGVYKEGTNVTVYEAPYVDGYIFSGWSTADADISKGNFNIYNNVVIVGTWKKAPGPVTEITVPKDFTLVLGEETVLNAYVNENAINKGLVYESSNNNIATVDANGNVKSVGKGVVEIKISSAENPAIYGVVKITVKAEPAYDTKHYIVFGKTEKIGWYTVSLDGGETYLLVFGNSHLEVEHGSEIIVKAHDVFGDPFTFYINGKAVKPDKDGFVRVKVDSYILVGALGIPIEAPDAEESLNFIQRIIKAIKDFFAKIASWFKG